MITTGSTAPGDATCTFSSSEGGAVLSAFPAGTSVSVKAAAGHVEGNASGPDIATATVTSTPPHTQVIFTGLTRGARYVATGTVDGARRFVRFTAG